VKPSDQTIRIEFNKWVFANGKILSGLKRRREAEANLYFTI
jgi:GH24 family phage-related lysozyme (muramidase)